MVGEGVWAELIAFPCGYRYTMPLGVMVRGGRQVFRLYRGVGLLDIAARSGYKLVLRLLAPRLPHLFVESYFHRLEEKVSWEDDGCPRTDVSMGYWFECKAVAERVEGDSYWFSCDGGLKPLGGYGLTVYNRAYGCIVELLIIHSKLKAGVTLGEGYDLLSHARMLAWCVERSAPGDEVLKGYARGLLQGIQELVGEA